MLQIFNKRNNEIGSIFFVVGLLSLVVTVILLINYQQPVKASPVVGFIPGRIIDDTVFTNKYSMSASQIQAFLNSKVPVCDVNGTRTSEFGGGTRAQWAASRGYSPPFTCLKDFSEGGKTSAQIIYDAAQEFFINPQVLIVLLQKEQGLVLDDWPIPGSSQYRAATGYGCPDTAPCDSQYYGLTNQIRWSARMFRAIMDASPTWYTPYIVGSNYIQYNPNTSCGGTVVTIQNRSTQALYNYTPYQPNQGALDAGWGQADCGAYGNRNFYLYFNEWFGPTAGSIIRTYEDGKMYVRGSGSTYYHIVNGEQLTALGYGSAITTYYNTSSSVFQGMTFAGPLSSSVRFNSGASIYALDGGQKHIYDPSTWSAYAEPTPSNLAADLEYIIPTGSPMSTVIRNQNSFDLYAVENGLKRYIGGPAIYQSTGYDAKPVVTLTNYLFNTLNKGAPLLSPGTFVKSSDTNVLSVVNQNSNTKRAIEPTSAKSIAIYPYVDTSAILNLITTDTSPPVTLLVKNSQNDLYLTDGTKKLHLSGLQLSSMNKTANDFILVDNTYLSRFTTVNSSGDLLIRIDGDERVYKIVSGEMVHIQTGEDFSKLGYSSSNAVVIKQNTATLLFTNQSRAIILEGTLFRVTNTPTVYLLGRDQKPHAITTGYVFDSFKFKWSSVRQITPATLAFYVNGDRLSYVIQTPDNARWLISNGLRYWIPTNLHPNYTSTTNPLILTPNSTLATINPTRNATQFIRIDDTPTIFYVIGGEKRALSQYMFATLGGTLDQVISVSKYTAGNFQTGLVMY